MKIPYLRLILPTMLVLFAIHGLDFLFAAHNPSGGGADGIKNLYTFAWYADYNESSTNFEGMAYPYGEHVFFTDGHPALGFLWKPISQILGGHGWSAHLLTFLIHLSWLLTPIPLFLIFRHFGVRKQLATLGAIGFTLLAPQILRDGGHYALAYTIALPLSWWLTLRALRDELPWKQLIVLSLLHLWWLGTHAYLGVMTIGFSALIFGFEWLKKPAAMKKFFAAVITGGVPMLVFLLFLKWTDQHQCRLDTPYGFFDFLSSPRSIFFPQNGPFSAYTQALGFTTKWEGWAYIGASAGLMLLSFLFWGYRAFKRKRVSWLLPFLTSLLAAALLFLVACGQPFIWFGRSSIEYFPVLEQFRGIGRFAWPLYFALASLSLMLLNTAMELLPKKVGFSVSAAFFLLLAVEALSHQQSLNTLRGDGEHPFGASPPKNYIEAVDAIKESEIDVMLPLPYFHLGSEVYGRFVDGNMEEHTLILSYHAGKPTFAAHLTRASLAESRNLLELLASAEVPKQIGQELDLDMKVCLVNDGSWMDPDEEFWWKKGATIFKNEQLELRTLPLGEMIQRVDGNYPEFQASAPYSFHDTKYYYFNPLDSINSGIHFEGNGHFEAPCDGITVLSSFTPDSSWIGKRFMATLYMRGPDDGCLEGKYRLNAQLIAQFVTGETFDWVALNTPKQASEHPTNGSWAKTYITFDMKNGLPDRLDLLVKGEWRCEGPICVDALELMEVD